MRKMLNADFRDSPSEESSTAGQKKSTAMTVTMKVDGNSHDGSYQSEDLDNNEAESDDDVFPLEPPNHFLPPKSATIGRLPLMATQSMLDLTDVVSNKPAKMSNQLRPLDQTDSRRQRQKTESQLYSSDFQVSGSTKLAELWSDSKGLQNLTKSQNSEKIRRQGALRRKSTRDLDLLSCLLRLHTEDGWSEVISCTST